jgi:hypothetical protein
LNARIIAACAAFAAVALVVAGCSTTDGQPVQLLTGVPEGGENCHLLPFDGLLVVDPKYGTAIITDAGRETMSWRPGFTGRRIGSEVEVVDPNGRVQVTTGRRISYYRGGSVVAGVTSVWNCIGWEGWPARPSG